MSNVLSSRRMSVDVHASHQAVARPPCSPITNEDPTLRKKGSFSFASLLPKRPASRASNNIGTQSAPAALPSKPKKTKKPTVDLVAEYGADFARAVAANQFLNGGSLDEAISRVKHDQEKMARRRAEKHGVPYVPDSVAPVRGLNGELFRDAQEESERRGLVRDAYKGMSSTSSSKHRGMRPEDSYAYAEHDREAPAWAQFRASPAAAPSTRHRSSTTSGSARADFFSSSFAPPMPTATRA